MDNGSKWRVGDVEVSRIPEFEVPLFDPAFIYPDLPRERLDSHRSWLEPRLLDPATGKLVLSIHAFVIRTRRHAILVDACSGNDKERPSRPLFHRQNRPWLERLAAAGFRPEEIDFVLCTHLHIDHVGWNTRLLDGRWVATFPRARYLITRAEWDHWQDEDNRKAYADDNHIRDSILPIIESRQAEFVAMDHVIDDEVWFEPTPGHTPGHAAVHISSGGQEAVISGDLMHTAVQVAEPEISSCFCVDKALSARTRVSFLERYADRPVIVLPAHFPTPTGGFVTPEGSGFRFRFDT
jgi:glyoxylase-like metal-dependent hydrolase (beta-lactamase superfamily II)